MPAAPALPLQHALAAAALPLVHLAFAHCSCFGSILLDPKIMGARFAASLLALAFQYLLQ